MADYPITASSVTYTEISSPQTVVIGENVTEGRCIYLDSVTDRYFLADATDETKGDPKYITLSAGVTGEWVMAISDGTYTAGTTLVQGDPIFLSKTAGAGAMAPDTDLVATNFVTQIGFAVSTTEIAIDFNNTGIEVA